jgi:spore maturation protein CgeB
MELSNAKICITEGGGNNYPVRKFFEIPASGALMACWPAVGLENLGYRHGEHCIYLNSSDDIFELIADMKKDITKYQHVADQGRKQTLDHHSATARSKQLKESFERILANSFSGSYWKNGIYQLS